MGPDFQVVQVFQVGLCYPQILAFQVSLSLHLNQQFPSLLLLPCHPSYLSLLCYPFLHYFLSGQPFLVHQRVPWLQEDLGILVLPGLHDFPLLLVLLASLELLVFHPFPCFHSSLVHQQLQEHRHYPMFHLCHCLQDLQQILLFHIHPLLQQRQVVQEDQESPDPLQVLVNR